MQHFQEGLSQEVSGFSAAPWRPSTNACRMIGGFASLAWPQNKELIRLATSAQKASFLHSLFRTHSLSPQMVKGYRSCLRHTGKGYVVKYRISVKPRLTATPPSRPPCHSGQFSWSQNEDSIIHYIKTPDNLTTPIIRATGTFSGPNSLN